MKKLKDILKNESGSPQVEQIIEIAVMLLFVAALCGMGAIVIKWVGGATSAVSSLNL